MKHTTKSVSVSRRSIPVISALVIASFTAVLWAASEEWKAPSFRARKKNPIAADAQSISLGKTLYIQECLSCHGSAGKGDGSAAKDLEKTPGDLSSPSVVDQTDGALFWKVSTGRSPMPTFETLMTDQQRWHLVNYIRTLAVQVPVTTPRYDAPAAYRQAISSVVDPYLTLIDHMAGDKSDVPTSQAQAIATAVETLATTDPADLPEAARQPWLELTEALRQDVQKLKQSQDADGARLQLKSVSDDLTLLVQAFGHAGDTPLVLLLCDKSFDQAGASWIQSDDRSHHNPYSQSVNDPDCNQAVVARLAPEFDKDDKSAS